VLERPARRRPTAKPKASAERRRQRQRAYQKRQRESRIIAPVEVDAATLDLLCRLGWLTEHESGDRHRIGAAIRELLRAAR